ncbi:MAG: ABC transporter permease [Thermodesulfobacteriota bacterium]
MISYLPWIRQFLRDRLAVFGLFIILLLIFVAIFAPYLASTTSIHDVHLSERLQPPSSRHLFGTDNQGRDIFSRVIYGSRITIVIAILAIGASLFIGVPLGLIAGYSESWMSNLIQRISDIFLSIPQLILAIAIAAILKPSITTAIIALSLTYWPWFSRLVYAQTRAVKAMTFIEATQALGASTSRIIFLHVLPNTVTPIIIRSTIGMGYTILTAATLGFLGAGAQPPSPEWGLALAEAREFLPKAWWYALFPGLAIFTVVMGFNMLGDGLRDVIDPRLRVSKR